MTAAIPGRAGTVVWIDLSTPDPHRAMAFYGSLLGWEHDEQVTPAGTYVVERVAGGEVGGLMEQSPDELASGIPARWTVFFACDGLEACLDRAQRLGGSVLQPPLPIPGGVRVAAAADPTGAVFGLMEGPLAEHGLVRQGRGSLSWVECLSRDAPASRRFHEELFGWKSEEGTGGYVMLSLDGVPVGGLMAMPPTVPGGVPSSWSVYFAVDDAGAACALATELGGTVLEQPHDIDEGRFAVLADPLGAVFSVFESGHT